MNIQTNPEVPEDVQLEKLVQEELVHLLDDSSTDNTKDEENIPAFNVYFDKQLTHLVLEEQFNFKNISKILAEVFKHDKIDTSEKACEERWAFLHRNRNRMSEIRQKQKQDKRIKSVAAFSNPYSLYSVEQLIQNLQQQQKAKENNSEPKLKLEQPTPQGYNIMKDSFRKISNFQEYNELEAKMKQALKKAQEQVYEDMPLYFTPQYQKLQQFQVKGEELTAEKAKQLMAYQIQMEKISRELVQKKEQEEEDKYESIIKKRIQKEQKMSESNENGDIDDDWDQYQSD